MSLTPDQQDLVDHLAKFREQERSIDWREFVGAVRPALKLHGDYIGFSGTAFCGRVFEQLLVVTARHVMCAPTPENFRIATDTIGPTRLLWPSDVYWYNDGDPASPGPWDHGSDIAIGCLNHPVVGSIDFQTLAVASPAKGDVLLAVGYPKETSKIFYDQSKEPTRLGQLARAVGRGQIAIWSDHGVVGRCADDGKDPRDLREIEFTQLHELENLDGMSGSPVLVMTEGSSLCKFGGMLVRGDAKAKRGYFIDGRMVEGHLARVALKNPRTVRRLLKMFPRRHRRPLTEALQFVYGHAPRGSKRLEQRQEWVAAVLAAMGIDLT